MFYILYRYSGRDLLNPACVLGLFSLFALIIALYLYDFWDLYNYGTKATCVFLVGLFFFDLASFVVTKPNMHNFAIWKKSNFNNGIIYIRNLNFYLMQILVLFSCIFFLVHYRNVVSVSSVEMIAEYKEYRTGGDANMPIMLNVMMKFVQIIAYFDAFIFVNNLFYRIVFRDLKYLITPILFIVISLLIANRGNILELFMGIFACWYILYLRIYGFNKCLPKIMMKYGLITVLVVLSLFFFSVVHLLQNGRDWSDIDPIKYVIFYVSGPIVSLDVYFEQGGAICRWWGEETFVALNNNLATLFGLPVRSQRFLEFRETMSFAVVNIYTSFRRFYHDFGMFGVVVLSFIQGYITTLYYRYVLMHRFKLNVDLPLCLFCCFFYTIPYTFTDELFYSSNVSFSGLFKIMMIIVLYEFYFSRKSYRIV